MDWLEWDRDERGGLVTGGQRGQMDPGTVWWAESKEAVAMKVPRASVEIFR